MRVLLIYPAYPETFWSFKSALKFISRQAVYPPLGLVTVAALLPKEWELRLVDLNVQPLTDEHLGWAQVAMISAMEVQRLSVDRIVERCRQAGVRTVAGGPLFTASPDAYDQIDHLVLNEAECTLPGFLADLARGEAQHRYTSDGFADMAASPVPRWDLVNMRQYASMNLQYSRGCPYDCEFCDITALFGRRPRTKETRQIVAELDALAESGWKGSVFFVDDNFIGHRRHLKEDLLPALIEWNSARRLPMSFNTEASVNLADDPELMNLMARAGFDTVFVGIESPSEDSLAECNKNQNRNRDLLDSVRRMQRHGLQVQGGFILGFDSDPANIFDRMGTFIQQSGIVTAMVGLLNAPKLSRLYRRLKGEDRIRPEWSGDNTDCSTNIVTRLPLESLVEGYHGVLRKIYSHRAYYDRIRTFLRTYRPQGPRNRRVSPHEVKALLRSIWVLGVREKGRRHYWSLLAWTAARRPSLIPTAVTLAIYGHHFRAVFRQAF